MTPGCTSAPLAAPSCSKWSRSCATTARSWRTRCACGPSTAGCYGKDEDGEEDAWQDGKRRADCGEDVCEIDLVNPRGTTTRVKRSRRGPVDNCAEGGPNFGFDLAPRKLGLGCAGGRWKPGRYAMTTRVTDLRTGLLAQASLYRQVTRRC